MLRRCKYCGKYINGKVKMEIHINLEHKNKELK